MDTIKTIFLDLNWAKNNNETSESPVKSKQHPHHIDMNF